MTILTIGHSTLPIDTFVGRLLESDVARLVDVRSVPRSRTNPQFNADGLSATLSRHGIAYTHLRSLGGLRGRQDLGRPSPNEFWTVAGFRNYSDYALTESFQDAFGQLLDLARSERCAVMCAEALWWKCHRRIVADYLLVAGMEVRHVMADGRIEAAELTPVAEVQPDATVHYPATQGRLL